MQIFVITHLRLWFQVNSQNPITTVPKSFVTRNWLCKVLKLILSIEHTWDSTWFLSHPPDYITQHWKNETKKPWNMKQCFVPTVVISIILEGWGFKSSAPPRVSTCNLGAFPCLHAHVLGAVCLFWVRVCVWLIARVVVVLRFSPSIGIMDWAVYLELMELKCGVEAEGKHFQNSMTFYLK